MKINNNHNEYITGYQEIIRKLNKRKKQDHKQKRNNLTSENLIKGGVGYLEMTDLWQKDSR